MALPTFTAIPDTDVDYSSPADGDLFTAHRDRNDHLRRFFYDVTKHRPVKAHDHDGRNSTRVAVPHLPNLIYDGHASQGWSVTGCTLTTDGINFTASGQRATHQLLDTATPLNAVKAFGSNGCTLLVAMVARIVGTVTAATIDVGFANGNAIPSSAEKRYAFTQADLSSGWTRIYGFWQPFKPGAAWTACRSSIATSGTWTGAGSIDVDYVLVKPVFAGAPRLCYWQPGYSEDRFPFWENVQAGDAPLYEKALNFTDATKKAVA